MWKEIPPFSFSAGERKIMAHFVVKCPFLLWLRLCRAGPLWWNNDCWFGCSSAATERKEISQRAACRMNRGSLLGGGRFPDFPNIERARFSVIRRVILGRRHVLDSGRLPIVDVKIVGDDAGSRFQFLWFRP